MAKNEPKRINITSPDLNAERLDAARRLLPDLFDDDGNLDERALSKLVRRPPSTEIERFRFEWTGKQESKRLAFSPSRATLVADKNRSIDFDNTKNLIIEGDNLEVLKLLQTTYFEQVKCIYIDPPYNTGKDFIYPDNYSEDKKAYWENNGVIKDSVKLVALAESDGRKHSKWLNMLQSRLYTARNLLRQDGAIIIHIDENEGHRLRFLLEEIFGNENFLGEVVWDKRNPKGDASKVSYQHESLLIFAKNAVEFEKHNELKVPKRNAETMLKNAAKLYALVGKKRVPSKVARAMDVLGVKENGEYETEYTLENANTEFQEWIIQQGTALSGGEAAYKYIDNEGKVYRLASMAWPSKKKAPDEYFTPLIHPVTGKPCPVPQKGWRNPPETMRKLLEEGLIMFGNDETTQPQRIYILEDNMSENLPSLLYYGGSDDALLKEMGISFDNPKPVEVAARLMTGLLDKDDIVMDFFAGSGTTGHAALKLNAESERDIRFILVQVPEQIDEEHIAHEAGYKTILELCIDRIKNAGEKIKNSNPMFPFDTGFRVYRLQESYFPENLFKHDPDKSEDENLAALDAHIEAAKQTILFDKDDLENIITEIALKNGYGLFFTLDQIKELAKNTVYRLSGNGKDTLLCLDLDLQESTVETLTKKHAEEQLIVSKSALDTAETWTLRNAFGDNLRVV